MLSFLYVLVSDPSGKYSDMTAVSASFLRYIHPEARIRVLCDPSTRDALVMIGHPLLGLADEVIAKEAPYADLQSRNRYLKSRMRLLIDGDFLYLDADTLPIGKLDELFLIKEPVALAHNHNRRYPENFPDSEKEYYRKCGWNIPSDGHYLNAGVIFWRSCPDAIELTRHYQQAVDSIHRNGLIIRDQPAFNRALSVWGGEVGILPDRYNAQVEANPLSGLDASLWHFYESVNTGKKRTFLDEGLDLFHSQGYVDAGFMEKVRRSRIHFYTKNYDQEVRLVNMLKEKAWVYRKDLLAITEEVPVPECTRTFCTVITSNYLPYALNLLQSIREHDQEVHFNVLISDTSRLSFDGKCSDSKTFFKFPEDVASEGVGLKIMQKYRDTYHDAFRWSCKSVLINYLILECGYKKVIYMDCDMYFFNPFSFLFDALDTHRVLLTPHWRTPHPNCNSEEYKLLFSDGLYNAGFIGANSNAVDAMDWWAENCLYSCSKNQFPGEYVDQAILNLMPVYFEGIHVLRHLGCNVSIWNMNVCRRIVKLDGFILINDEYPVVFIHFSSNIPRSSDPMLVRYFDKYMEGLRSFSESAWQREMQSRMLANINASAEFEEYDQHDRGWIFDLTVKKFKVKRIASLYWMAKSWIIGSYLSKLRWEKTHNIAVFTQASVENASLGHWLREVPGTVLANQPIRKDCLMDWEDSGVSEIPGDGFQIGSVVKGDMIDPIHVSWTEWTNLFGIRRMVLNLPVGWLERPALPIEFSKHCHVVALLIHPFTYACHKLAGGMGTIEKSRLQEVQVRIQTDPSLERLIVGRSSEWLLWIIRWCMDFESLMDVQKIGRKIHFMQKEWLETDTQTAIESLCKSLSLSMDTDLAKRYTKYFIPKKSSVSENGRPVNGFEWEGIIGGHENDFVDEVLKHFKVPFYNSKTYYLLSNAIAEQTN